METLLDRLRKKHTKDDARKNRHAVNILAHRDEIIAALSDGWSARKIWALMVEDNMTAMSYVSFCRHVKKTILPYLQNAIPPKTEAVVVSGPHEKHQAKIATPKVKPSSVPPPKLSEKERLDALKEEAFAAVRSRKPTGSLIEKPKSREEENRQLFGL
jgi:hypothetical protein